MASTPAEPNRDTLRDLLPIFMWDDEKPKPVGAIDHDGWGYIYYGPEYNYLAATNGTAFNFAQAADNFIHNAQAANAATAPTHIHTTNRVVDRSRARRLPLKGRLRESEA